MEMKGFLEKVILVITGTWISERLCLLMPILGLLVLFMILDYISGILASKKEALEHPNSKKYGLSSKKSILGIYKKIGYVLTIFIAICIDYLIYKFADEIGLQYNTGTTFGLLVTIWFLINEMISILENSGRMGVELPDFLKDVLSDLKKGVEDKEE